MNKEFIPYEQALELKELGFDEECVAYYHTTLSSSNVDLVLGKTHNRFYYLVGIPEHFNTLAPLYQQAFRWFREKHNWIGGIRNLDTNNQIIVADFVKDEDNSFMIWGESYEDAELKALKELIERIKTN